MESYRDGHNRAFVTPGGREFVRGAEQDVGAFYLFAPALHPGLYHGFEPYNLFGRL